MDKSTTGTIICADCLVALDNIRAKSIDLVVTSPPYNIGKKYDTHSDNMDRYIEFLSSAVCKIKRVLKPMVVRKLFFMIFKGILYIVSKDKGRPFCVK